MAATMQILQDLPRKAKIEILLRPPATVAHEPVMTIQTAEGPLWVSSLVNLLDPANHCAIWWVPSLPAGPLLT